MDCLAVQAMDRPAEIERLMQTYQDSLLRMCFVKRPHIYGGGERRCCRIYHHSQASGRQHANGHPPRANGGESCLGPGPYQYLSGCFLS